MANSLINRLKYRWHAQAGYHEVLTIAVPLILSTGSTSLHAFFSRIFLTWHSPVSLAAAMPASMVNFAIMSIFLNTAGYVSTFVAQYYGSGQNSKVGPIVWQAGMIAVVGGIINLLLIPLAPIFFAWVGHDAEVQASEVAYFQVLCLAAFPAIMASALSGMMAGLGRTKIVMWIVVFCHPY